MKRAKLLVAVWLVVLPALFFPSLLCAQDADGDGVSDRNDNCVGVLNLLQEDLEWSTQAGTLVLYDDSLAIHSWATPPLETGSTVHDGDTAMKIIGNNLITEIAPDLGQSGPQRYLRFWIYLTSPTADLALQMNCGDGEGWDHKWGFSGNGTWEGEAWAFNGRDYNLPVGQWLPIMLDIQGALSCDNGKAIYGIGWDVLPGNTAFVDSAAFYSTRPSGDVCDFTSDFDGDGLSDAQELGFSYTDPADPDSDDDGLSDGDEVNTWLTDPNDPDSDGDNLSDGNEVNYFGTDPNLPDADTDSDGLPDVVDLADTGTDPNNPDTDGDGVNDGVESLGGSNPLNPDVVPAYLKSGDDVRITSDGSNSGYPSLIWTGSEFGVSWHDSRDGDSEIYFTRISPLGSKLGGDERITNYIGNSSVSSLTWTGSEFVVSWEDERFGNDEIYFTRISAGGTEIGDDTRITIDGADSWEPSLTWTGSEFGASWTDYRDGNWEVYFTRISAGGTEIGDDTGITIDGSDSLAPSLAWTGSEFGVSWTDYRDGNYEIYFTRISAGGTEIGDDIRITNDGADLGGTSLIWTGSEFGVCWYDFRDGNGEVYFTRISAAGNKIGDDVRITTDGDESWVPSLTWTGSEFGVSWYDGRGDGYDEIYFTRISAAGTEIGDDIRITNDGASSGAAQLTWTGSEFGVSWQDSRDGNLEIYFALIVIDQDGDRLAPAVENLLGTDPSDWDTDDDGVSDGDEYLVYGSNPLDPDTDNDGLSDGLEINVIQTDPLTDGDADGDGLTDAEEVLFFGTDPHDADMDDDGLTDYEELFVYLSDPWFIDTDGDGLSDWSEVYVTHTSPVLEDTDSDGVPDGMEVGDALTDRDGDEMPNVWEKTYSCLDADTADAAGDFDSDGLTNLEEYNAGTDPCEADTDGDGLDDDYEINVPLTSPLLADTDGDGLDDGAEVNTHSTDPLDPDSDDDGFSDGAEVAAGTDPNDPNSIPVQPPRLINYQGRLSDASGVAVGGTVSMRFQIFTSLAGATVAWGETQASVSVQQGIYSVLLGSVSPLAPGIFSNPELYLEVSVNGEALTPRQRITSVPFAVKAEELLGGRLETDVRVLAIGAPASSVTMRVSFNQAFAAPPRVWVSALDSPIGGRKFIDTLIFNVTADGFDVTFDSLTGEASAGTASFTYAAFGN